jgi:GNAT superfamily N-acetyltransferase
MPRLLTFPDGVLPPELHAQVRAILRAEYPTLSWSDTPRSLDDPQSNPILLTLLDGDSVLSYLAIPSKLIHHAGETYQAYGLSSVITHPLHRHQGYGSQIVTAAWDLIADSDADIGIFTCDPHLVDFYVSRGWTLMPTTTVVGGTRAKPFPADSLGKRTLMGFFSPKALQRQSDFEGAAVYLELREGDLW